MIASAGTLLGCLPAPLWFIQKVLTDILDLHSKTYTLTGPQPILFTEVVERPAMSHPRLTVVM